MDIHKPKPWRGWREFLKEYLIIVVGVLTALGAEQAVETLHWRHLTAQAREELAADQRRSLRWIGLTDIFSGCALTRLNELAATLDKAERDGRLPPIGPIDGPPNAAWGILRRGEAALYAQEAITSEALKRWRDEGRLDWGVLATMSGRGRPLSSAEAASLRAALGRAHAAMSGQRRSADSLGQQVLDTGLLTRTEVNAWWRKGADMLPRISSVCAPLSNLGPSQTDILLAAPPAPPSQHWTNQDDYGDARRAGH